MGERAHGGNGLLLASGGAIESLVVGQGDIAVRRMIAIKLAVDAHGVVGLALTRQLAGVAKLVALATGAGQRFDLGDIWIVGVDFAQAIDRVVGLVDGADQLVVLGQAGEGFDVFGIGEQDLLPELDGHVGPAAGLQCMSLFSKDGARA